jgi:predicted O-methyltransferase YrrM
MNETKWADVDRYLVELFAPPDAHLSAALAASAAAGLPSINVSPNQGKLLMLLAQVRGARRILEIGTLGGYSTIWLARALAPGGRLITLESEERHAAVARSNIERAGLADRVEIRLGHALDSLRRLTAENAEPFDFVFIDADKPGYPDYLTESLKLCRLGTLLVADNVIRDGAVIDSATGDPRVLGVRRFNALLAADPRVSATALQTVGSKGYDGLAIAVVVAIR